MWYFYMGKGSMGDIWCVCVTSTNFILIQVIKLWFWFIFCGIIISILESLGHHEHVYFTCQYKKCEMWYKKDIEHIHVAILLAKMFYLNFDKTWAVFWLFNILVMWYHNNIYILMHTCLHNVLNFRNNANMKAVK